MTISSDLNKHVYDGNGITVNWPYTFQIILESDIKVYLTSPEEVTTLLTANYEIDTDNSRVVYPTPASLLYPLPTGWHITLVREEPYTQETDLKSQGPWSAEVFELAYDKLTMLCQQLKEITNRCIKYAIDQNPTDSTTSSFLSAIETARDTAGGYADAALVSKNAAAVSAAAALVSQNAASASASAASGSASAASNSATLADASADAAALSESNASASATAANNSKLAAAGSASTATTKAGEANSSAIAAAASAGSASTSAGTATTQAGIATTKAGEANDSAIAAAASAASISDPLLRDHINEATAGHGTAINGAVVKGGTNTFSVTNGTASLDVAAGATVNVDSDFAVEAASAVNQDLTTDASPTFTAVSTDTVNEKTSDAGVTVDGAIIKDGAFEGIVSDKCIDIVQVNNLGIADNDTDTLVFDFVPSKIVIEYQTICVTSANGMWGMVKGQCVITITGTDTCTSLMHGIKWYVDLRYVASPPNDFGYNYVSPDTTNAIAGRAGFKADAGTALFNGVATWNTATKTLIITYQETMSDTESNLVQMTATAYK